MREFVLYSLARLGILIATFVIVLWIAKISILSLVAAVLVATMLSYLLLGGMRKRAADAMADRREAKRRTKAAEKADPTRAADTPKRKLGRDESVEDDAIDAGYPDLGASSPDVTEGSAPDEEVPADGAAPQGESAEAAHAPDTGLGDAKGRSAGADESAADNAGVHGSTANGANSPIATKSNTQGDDALGADGEDALSSGGTQRRSVGASEIPDVNENHSATAEEALSEDNSASSGRSGSSEV